MFGHGLSMWSSAQDRQQLDRVAMARPEQPEVAPIQGGELRVRRAAQRSPAPPRRRTRCRRRRSGRTAPGLGCSRPAGGPRPGRRPLRRRRAGPRARPDQVAARSNSRPRRAPAPGSRADRSASSISARQARGWSWSDRSRAAYRGPVSRISARARFRPLVGELRRAVSVTPEAPMPRLFGRGACCSIVASIASRISAAMEIPRSAAMRRNFIRVSTSRVMVVRSMMACYHN